MTEALGGFWSSTTQDDVQFVALDEYISKKFLEDVEGDLATHELVLETDL